MYKFFFTSKTKRSSVELQVTMTRNKFKFTKKIYIIISRVNYLKIKQQLH